MRSCPLRVQRYINSSNGLEDLSNTQERLLHTEGLSVHPLDEATVVLKEDDGHLATQGLPLVAPLFPASQGLVLGDVEDDRRFA